MQLDLWYKNAVIYSIDVDTFMDGNGDGIGDFVGLGNRLDYLARLGVTCLWLLPFYPTPNRDNGYDVKDYYGVDPRLGTLGDFVDFTRQARERGMRIIVDLVVNHTSIEHPWFQQARSNPDSPYRDYYVWSEEKPPDAHEGVVFPGVQESIWTYDKQVGAYYLHRFYEHQPDLNFNNPAVREEIRKIMGFWLELGVSGFRLDAAPFVIELKGIQQADVKDPHEYLEEMREFLSWRRGDAILLAEANVPPNTIGEYFGKGDRMHLLFNFMLNQHTFLALAKETAAPIKAALKKLPRTPDVCQWATFLRNHDELDLARLPRAQRQDVFEQFAPDENMRLYGRGIRRRLAPMLGGDLNRLKMAYSLLLSLPGTPVLWYGEEIGMGEDLSLDERNSVRTPMQWSDEENAGFSTAPPPALFRPVISGGPFGYQRVNVARQRQEARSLLTWMQQAINTRQECPEFGWGEWQILEVKDPHVFAHCCTWQTGTVVALHNLSKKERTVELDLSRFQRQHAVGLLGDEQYRPLEKGLQRIELGPYGYRWIRLLDRRAG